ncbi:MAG: NAD(P)-dependent oxidoreductase [Thermoanaerobaculia bacterium]
MRVLVADKFEPSGLAGLRDARCEVVYEPEAKGDGLVAKIRDARPEVLVVRGNPVTPAMLDAGPLALVVRAGAGFNTIDVAAASARGIYVANCPGKNSIAVAELTIGLLLALDRRIPDNVADLRAGKWNKKEYSRARGIYGSTLGVIGLGSIGCEVIRRAAAFGMPIVAWSRRFDGLDRPLSGEELRELGIESAAQLSAIRLAPSPAETAARADALTVHVALGKETRGLIGEAVLSRLRRGAIFLNTARGEVVDAESLARIAREKSLRLGLDVFAHEPAGGTGEFTDPIVGLPLVYGTHHIGASTEQAQEAIAAATVRIVRTYKDSGKVLHCVNLARRTPATHRLVVRHRNRPGVLAHVFERLRDVGINVQETENIVFDGAEAAIARIDLDAAPARGVLEAIQADNPHVLDLKLVAI